MTKAFSKFHKLTICDSLEALAARNYNTPFPSHFHQTYNISLILAGTFRTKVDGRTLLAQPGAILITNPHEIHANPCEENESASFFTFYVSADFFRYSSPGKPAFFRDNVIYDAFLFDALNRVADKIEAGSAAAEIEDELSRTLNLLTLGYAASGDETRGLVNHQSLFKDYLTGGEFDKFSLDHSAKQFGIDKYKFLRLFKYQTGLTPNNYVILTRIEKSKEMLLAGTDILSVAIDLGFYDIPHFSKHFKKFTGISPAAYGAVVAALKGA